MTPEQIQSMPRGDVRYALFRMQTGTAIDEHKEILEYFIPRLIKYNLKPEEFSESWDISKTCNIDIVSGHIIHQYKEESKSLFNEDGSLKE